MNASFEGRASRTSAAWERLGAAAALGLAMLAMFGLLLGGLGISPAALAGLPAAFASSHTLRVVSLGAACIGLLGGALGSFAVLRGQSLLGDAVSHSALPGIYLAFGLWTWLGAEGMLLLGLRLPAARSLPVVLLGALVTGVMAALLVIQVARSSRLQEDAALGLTLSTFFGAGLVLRSLLQRSGAQRAGLEAFLFGTAATISRGDARWIALISLIVIGLLALFWKELQLLTFDPDYLASLGFPARRVDLLLTGLIVLSVIAGLQVVGVILMSAMLIAPAVAARQWTDRLSTMTLLAAAFGLASAMAGVLLSYLRSGLATGPFIALIVTSLALFSLLLAPRRGILWAAWRRRRRASVFRVDTLLLHLQEQSRALAQDRLGEQLGWSQRMVDRSLQRARSRGWVEEQGVVFELTDAGRARCRSRIAELDPLRSAAQEPGR